MAGLAAVNASTNRACTATLDATGEWTPSIFVPGGFQLQISIIDNGAFAGTVGLYRKPVVGTYERVTDSDGVDYSWTTDATPVVRFAQAYTVRLITGSVTGGEVAVKMQVGNRE